MSSESEQRLDRVERNLESLTQRIDSQINLMAELRVGQVVLNNQISRTDQQVAATQQQLAATEAAVLSLTSAMARILPVIQTQQDQLEKQREDFQKEQERSREEFRSHQERIEDLYKSQSHLLKRLFGESED